MGNFASYQTDPSPVGELQDIPQTAVVRESTGVHSVTIRNGVSANTNSKHCHVSSQELSPFSADDWRGTAVKPNGFPAMEITEDTRITLGGTQARVGEFLAAGLLVKNPDGSYDLAPEQTENAPQDGMEGHDDIASFPDAVDEVMQNAAAPFPQEAYDAGVMQAMHATITGGSLDRVVQNLAKSSGLEPGDVAQRVNFLYDQFQTQAARYVEKRGIAQEDMQSFFEFCRKNPGELENALSHQLYAADMSGWKGLISRFQEHYAPSVEVLEANGFQTRNHGQEPEVRIGGIWMTVKGAARAGLV